MDPLSYRHRIVSGSNPENYIEETKLTILLAVCCVSLSSKQLLFVAFSI